MVEKTAKYSELFYTNTKKNTGDKASLDRYG